MPTSQPKKTVLLVHAGSASKRFILQKLKQMGVRVVCLNREKVPEAQQYVDHWIIADLNNPRECIASVKSFIASHKNIHIEGAVTFWDECVLLTSKIIDTFNWIGIPFEVAKRVKNKYSFRDFCHSNGILTPRHTLLHNEHDIPHIAKTLTFPVVVKPIYGACSAFVVKVNKPQELKETYEYIKEHIRSFWLAPEWENLELFVEEYIDGDEVDIDILVQNGKIKFYSIADNFNKNKDRFFVDSGQAIPSTLPLQDQEALMNMAEETLEKLGLQHGCIHFEAKLAKKGPYPIEVNMRMGGDYVYSYIKGAWGVDLVEYATKIALGEYVKIDKSTEPLKYIVGWDLHPDSSGILVELDIDEELKKKSYLEEMYIVKEIGDTILMPPEGYDNLGWITVSGDNLLDAQDNLQEALKSISYKVVKFTARESTMGKTARHDRFSAAVVKDSLLFKAAKIEKVRRVGFDQQRRLSIGIIGNSVTSAGGEGEAKAIQKELEKRGYTTTFFDLNFLFRAWSDLRRDPVDIIFNAAEEINGDPQLQSQATALLEALQIPYTGSYSLTLALSRDKIKTKKFLTYHSIPTPRWDYAYLPQHTISEELSFPLIIKPGVRDTGLTIKNTIVKNKEQLKKHLNTFISDFQQPALIEEYVEGKEYEVIIFGNNSQDVKVLPLIRYSFGTKGPGIFQGEDVTSKERVKTECPPHHIDPKLESLITEIALDSYYIMRCRDFGSVRIRVDKDDNPYVIRVEANPPLTPTSSVARAAKAMKMDFGDLLEELLRLAIERYKNKPSLLI